MFILISTPLLHALVMRASLAHATAQIAHGQLLYTVNGHRHWMLVDPSWVAL